MGRGHQAGALAVQFLPHQISSSIATTSRLQRLEELGAGRIPLPITVPLAQPRVVCGVHVCTGCLLPSMIAQPCPCKRLSTVTPEWFFARRVWCSAAGPRGKTGDLQSWTFAAMADPAEPLPLCVLHACRQPVWGSAPCWAAAATQIM